MILEPGSIIHDFRIKNLIGSGGMGEVYLAEELILERKVAIKVIYSFLAVNTFTATTKIHTCGFTTQVISANVDRIEQW